MTAVNFRIFSVRRENGTRRHQALQQPAHGLRILQVGIDDLKARASATLSPPRGRLRSTRVPRTCPTAGLLQPRRCTLHSLTDGQAARCQATDPAEPSPTAGRPNAFPARSHGPERPGLRARAGCPAPYLPARENVRGPRGSDHAWPSARRGLRSRHWERAVRPTRTRRPRQ